jgi:MFS family permease
VAERQSSYVSIYLFAAVLIGAAVGLVFGALFDALIPGRRTLAVLSALAAVAAELGSRRYVAKAFPQVFVPPRSPSLIFISVVIALAGGLATHDLGLIWNVMSGAVLGFFSGLFAGLMASVLMVLKAAEQPVDRRP